MKQIRLFKVVILSIFFTIQSYSQGCYYPASFSYSNNSGTVSFTNTSTYISLSNWDFGDGSSSNLNHPSHTYTANGMYTVTLNLTYVFNMGVYGSFTCYSSTSNNIFINNVISTYGCMDSTSCNYNPSATIDDGSCTLAGTLVTLQMTDSYGDGWNGDTWIATSTSGGTTYGPFTINSGYSGSESFCLADDCYDIIVGGGLFPGETSWSLIDDNGTTLASGGSPYNSNLCSYTILSGCTDSIATNYDLLANTDDGSCTYINGCTDPTATNYDPLAVADDNSCIYICGEITGVNLTDLIHDRVTVNWADMNNSSCAVDQIRIRYRELGTSSYSTKTIGGPLGNNTTCLTTSKRILNLSDSTKYEYSFKIWYQDGTINDWHAQGGFTTLDACPNIANLVVTTPNPTRAKFTWDDSNGSYKFARIKIRVDSISNPTSNNWFNAGGFGTYYGVFTNTKNGLVQGETYRAQAKTWCDPAGGPYQSAVWTPLIFWTQPTTARIVGGSLVTNLDIYPNPSKNVFNIAFISDDVQNIELRIINVIGEVVYSNKLNEFIGEYTRKVDLTNYKKGVYFLDVTTNDGVVNKKLILQ